MGRLPACLKGLEVYLIAVLIILFSLICKISFPILKFDSFDHLLDFLTKKL